MSFHQEHALETFKPLPAVAVEGLKTCRRSGFKSKRLTLATARPNLSIEWMTYGVLRMSPVAAHVERWHHYS